MRLEVKIVGLTHFHLGVVVVECFFGQADKFTGDVQRALIFLGQLTPL